VAQTLTMGNSVTSPTGPATPNGTFTAVDRIAPAPQAGTMNAATFYWTAAPCAAAAKIKFFRPSGDTLEFITERGPFNVDASPQTVSFSAVSVQAGDLVGIASLTSCGSPMAQIPGSSAGFLVFSGDIKTATPLADGSATPSAVLAVEATGLLPPEYLASILPAAGSLPGDMGSFFRTSVQLYNPSAATISGRFVYHVQNVPGSSADPSLAYTLAPGQTRFIADLLPAMGLSGLGSVDVVAPVATPAPVVSARVFNDGGAAGTTGFAEDALPPTAVYTTGTRGVIFTPSDLTQFRMNVGVRTLSDGATITVDLRDASGNPVKSISRSYPPNYYSQVPATDFVGAPIAANETVTVTVNAGSVIVYAATADNKTQDPSVQFARPVP
jgi:hypothetical protein